MAIQRVRSKWEKTKVLLHSDELRQRIPVTQVWSTSELEQMLNEFEMVYVKPDHGTFGNGVIRVEKTADNTYTYQLGTKLQRFSSFESMAQSLGQVIQGRKYLIQQGIHLLTYDKRRFDVRVMVQRNLKQQWVTTGVIGRVSDPSRIVTNCHNGGTAMPFEKLMRSHLSIAQIASYQEWLAELGVITAQQMETSYKRIKEIGLDLAIDQSFRPWILEVNTMPDPYIFRKLPDKDIFRRIYRYHAANNRKKK
ncbi:YheC/YheD family protein [Paenibacillus lignilyticus]|uniref:YheC/YheD family protein n=1 Tax=Paenibacillus lignilyticus TaxID=1172615 RepID=A0ABS5CM01_9BACL|nr:YheC/YheD family protein [Paenibacillus lignilyticus]MBP3966900.1 YheC/YheD family protein [Paenibacillus lignilyticus]